MCEKSCDNQLVKKLEQQEQKEETRGISYIFFLIEVFHIIRDYSGEVRMEENEKKSKAALPVN